MRTPQPRRLRATLDLPPLARSIPAARQVIAQLLTAWEAERFKDDALLLLSELVTNVVRHVVGHAALTIEVQLIGPTLRVIVADGSTSTPVLGGRGVAGGHGLWLVDTLANRWGSEEHTSGKRVWFELDGLPPRPA
jgi:hypothetical protein